MPYVLKVVNGPNKGLYVHVTKQCPAVRTFRPKVSLATIYTQAGFAKRAAVEAWVIGDIPRNIQLQVVQVVIVEADKETAESPTTPLVQTIEYSKGGTYGNTISAKVV